MNHRYALCGLLALILPLTGCQKKPTPVPPPDQYAIQPVVQNPVIGADELYSLLAPVALYPDSLLTQVLAASHTPAAVSAAKTWQQEHSTLNGQVQDLQLKMKSWPQSVKSLVELPDVLTQMASNPQWVAQLGIADARQPKDVLNAVQVLRARALKTGALKSTSQQQVQVQIVPVTPHAVAPTSVPEPARIISIHSTQPHVPVYPLTAFGNPPVYYAPGYTPLVAFRTPMLAPGPVRLSNEQQHNLDN